MSQENKGSDDVVGAWEGLKSKIQDFLEPATSTKPVETSQPESSLFARYNKAQLEDIATRQQKLLGQVFALPFQLGMVAFVTPTTDETRGSVIVISNGRPLELALPEGIKILPGDLVRINPKTEQIVGIAAIASPGIVAIFRRKLSENFSEVDLAGQTRLVLNGTIDLQKVNEGDRIALDSSNTVILVWLGASERQYKFGKKPTITWDDIGGLEDAKRELKEAIILPITAADYYEHYRKKAINGVFLTGPPGCGKTMFFEACATEIARQHGEAALEDGYILLRGPDIMSEFVSVADRRLRTAFEMGRRYKRTHGHRAILAIDEAEALFKKRGSGISTDATDSIVQTFLGETNGLQDDNPFVILASNRPDVMDPAVIRNKRIDRQVRIGRPNRDSARQIVSRLLKDMPIVEGDTQSLTEYALERFYSPEYAFYDVSMVNNEKVQFTLASLASGALIDGLVDKATSVAIERDLKTKKKTGLCREDFKIAVERTFIQMRDQDHTEPLKEFAQDLKAAVLGIKPLRQVQLP